MSQQQMAKAAALSVTSDGLSLAKGEHQRTLSMY